MGRFGKAVAIDIEAGYAALTNAIKICFDKAGQVGDADADAIAAKVDRNDLEPLQRDLLAGRVAAGKFGLLQRRGPRGFGRVERMNAIVFLEHRRGVFHRGLGLLGTLHIALVGGCDVAELFLGALPIRGDKLDFGAGFPEGGEAVGVVL